MGLPGIVPGGAPSRSQGQRIDSQARELGGSGRQKAQGCPRKAEAPPWGFQGPVTVIYNHFKMQLNFVVERTEDDLMEFSIFQEEKGNSRLTEISAMNREEAKEFLRMLIITLDEVSFYALGEQNES